VSQIAGPSVGGVLLQALTAPYAVLVDAISFRWSASWVAAIKVRPPRPERKPDRHLGREIMEGLRFVLKNRLLRDIAMCTGSFNLLNNVTLAVYFILLARNLHLSAGIIGLFTSAAAVGGLLGSLVASRLARRFGQGPTILLSTLVQVPAGFVIPFVHRGWTLGLLAAAQLVVWGCGVIYNITQVSFRQGLCPPNLLGRMNATMRFLVWGTLPLGAFLGGVLGSTIGIRNTLLAAAIAGFVPVLPIVFSPLRKLRELPQYVSPDETASPVSESSH
jgi:MFS family permease